MSETTEQGEHAERRAQAATDQIVALAQSVSDVLAKLPVEDRVLAMRFATAVMEQLNSEQDAINLQIRGVRLQKTFAEIRELIGAGAFAPPPRAAD